MGDRIAKVEGRRGGLATLVITEQQGNTFAGHLKRSNPTGDEDEPLWGAFTPDGQLMMGSDEEGFYIFRLIDENTSIIVTARAALLRAPCAPGLPGSADFAPHNCDRRASAARLERCGRLLGLK